MPDPDAVYLTDSSWTSTGRHSGRRYHWPHPDDAGRPACGTRSMLDDNGVPAIEVAANIRCGRPGCQRLYAAHQRAARA